MIEVLARTEKLLGAAPCPSGGGLTQAELGERIHLRQGTISRLEAGEPAVQLRTLMRVLASLNLELVIRPRTTGSFADFEKLF